MEKKHTQAHRENKQQPVASAVAQPRGSSHSSVQSMDNRPEAVKLRKLQAMADNSLQAKQRAPWQAMAANYPVQQQAIQRKENNTGLPDTLKSGIENLSGYAMDDVKVHYNSAEPARLNAHAYARGTDIHVASGQEKHLPHEAWHVVQQKQGRVKATTQMKGMNVNIDTTLEHEADRMGLQAAQTGSDPVVQGKVELKKQNIDFDARGEHVISCKLQNDKLNVVGEDHGISGSIREREKDYNESIGLPREAYYEEYQFSYTDPETRERKPADNPIKRVVFAAAKIYDDVNFLVGNIRKMYNPDNEAGDGDVLKEISNTLNNVEDVIYILVNEDIGVKDKTFQDIRHALNEKTVLVTSAIDTLQKKLEVKSRPDKKNFEELITLLLSCENDMHDNVSKLNARANFLLTGEAPTKEQDEWFRELSPEHMASAASMSRSVEFHKAAQAEFQQVAVWKVGFVHFDEMKMAAEGDQAKYHAEPMDSYNEAVATFMQ
ncbi:eCIS core domain-containing protein [Dawidia soli]|uniref:DUF4157 domain-containing protein n=1 Tax=Dawidia soli TaxID=2782352 RepID=A0AAP2DFQ4_9BACT|nr:DUF4157 domain-containing protein [Dawidia soli]MBT1688497.1 DUF4157 domain-containing protein [Dawidia soli]